MDTGRDDAGRVHRPRLFPLSGGEEQVGHKSADSRAATQEVASSIPAARISSQDQESHASGRDPLYGLPVHEVIERRVAQLWDSEGGAAKPVVGRQIDHIAAVEDPQRSISLSYAALDARGLRALAGLLESNGNLARLEACGDRRDGKVAAPQPLPLDAAFSRAVGAARHLLALRLAHAPDRKRLR